MSMETFIYSKYKRDRHGKNNDTFYLNFGK